MTQERLTLEQLLMADKAALDSLESATSPDWHVLVNALFSGQLARLPRAFCQALLTRNSDPDLWATRAATASFSLPSPKPSGRDIKARLRAQFERPKDELPTAIQRPPVDTTVSLEHAREQVLNWKTPKEADEYGDAVFLLALRALEECSWGDLAVVTNRMPDGSMKDRVDAATLILLGQVENGLERLKEAVLFERVFGHEGFSWNHRRPPEPGDALGWLAYHALTTNLDDDTWTQALKAGREAAKALTEPTPPKKAKPKTKPKPKTKASKPAKATKPTKAKASKPKQRTPRR